MDLGAVDRITADTVGEPGSRIFYIQARTGSELATIIVEKEQVQLLASSVLELMANLDLETGTGPDESQMDLELPLDPLWRTGRLSIGYDEGRGMFLVEAEEFIAQPPELELELEVEPVLEREAAKEDSPEPAVVPDSLRLWATREQMFALSRHAAAVADRGRPACQFCGNPMDPQGHACPAMNGHSTRG